MKKTLTAIILALFGFAGLSTANADYLIGSYVDSDLEADSPFNEVFDDDANGWMIGYGWDTPHSWLSLELTYTDFGDSSETLVFQDDYYTETYNNTYEGEALDFWLVGRFSPFSIDDKRKVNIVPRVGLSAMHSRGTINYTAEYKGTVYSESLSADDSTIGYAYGLGLEVTNVLPNTDFFVDWRKHEGEMVYLGQVVDFDPSSIQAGINWHF